MNMKHIVSIIMLSLICVVALAQDQQLSIVVTQEDGSREVLQFKDSLSQEVISTLDAVASNPFNQLNYPIKETNEKGNNIYDLTGADTKQLLGNLPNNARGETEAIELTSAVTNEEVYANGNFAVVTYKMNMFGEEGGIAAMKGAAVVLNSKGEQVGTLPESDQGYRQTVITEDGRYVAYLYGETVVESSFSTVESPGFAIYDLQKKAKIVNVPSGQDFSVRPPFTYGNMIIEVLGEKGDDYTYHIYQPHQQVVYKKTYSREQKGQLKDITKEGFLFKDGRLDRYDSDFITESL